MPAERLSEEGMAISQSDVVGCDSKSESNFIRHVALSAIDANSIVLGDSIGVNHMGPPLQGDFEMPIHIHGTAALTDDELNQIELFIDEHLNEQEAQRRRTFRTYVIHPHTVLSEDSSFRRFSCTGYVIEAYENAGISLIDVGNDLPSVDLELLTHAYEELERIKDKPQFLEYLGLVGDDSWPVLLPGYIFHSMARQTEAIRATPYVPAEGDEKFPRE